jgi:crotonobetainyl-CoA:carnitine CoA-transferase CaiB-like acyl-CoA transferase
LRSALERLHEQDVLDADIAEWTSRHDRHALSAALQAAGVPAAAVQSPGDLLADSHLRERQFFQTVNRAVVGALPYPTAGIRLANQPLLIRRPSPLLGEHNRDVLSDLLGMSDAVIDMLHAARVIGSEPLALHREPAQQRQGS